MSELFRKSVDSHVPTPRMNTTEDRTLRPQPQPISHPPPARDIDDSSSSDSSASSAASVDTVRPSSREQQAAPQIWRTFFEQELYLEQQSGDQSANYHVYLTAPKDVKKGPLFICHHGAGASGLSFAIFAQELRARLPEAGILCLEARGHGSTVTSTASGAPIIDFSPAALTSDALAMINLTTTSQAWPQLPPSILIGHSLGGAVLTTLAASHWRSLGTSLVGYAVIDVVEGSALEAISHIKSYLASRPSSFPTIEDATTWHLRSRTLRNRISAEVSVPSILVPIPAADGKPPSWTWSVDYQSTEPWWEAWFAGMSHKFLTGHGAKLLILAGTDRLDRELMIGQMQGKFQLTVVPEAGHFVQEDVPAKTAEVMCEFWRRNDRGALVLPPKVDDLIKQGKKV